MAEVTFLPAGVVVTAASGESLFEAARRNGVAIATACVGQATCGLCRVKVVAGEHNLTDFGAAERRHLGNVYFITRQRLACQARLLSDDAKVSVEVPSAAGPR